MQNSIDTNAIVQENPVLKYVLKYVWGSHEDSNLLAFYSVSTG